MKYRRVYGVLVLVSIYHFGMLARQNEYKSVADRIHQEIHDRVHPQAARDIDPRVNDPHQKIMNRLYGGANTKGYRLDENGNEVPLDE